MTERTRRGYRYQRKPLQHSLWRLGFYTKQVSNILHPAEPRNRAAADAAAAKEDKRAGGRSDGDEPGNDEREAVLADGLAEILHERLVAEVLFGAVVDLQVSDVLQSDARGHDYIYPRDLVVYDFGHACAVTGARFHHLDAPARVPLYHLASYERRIVLRAGDARDAERRE